MAYISFDDYLKQEQTKKQPDGEYAKKPNFQAKDSSKGYMSFNDYLEKEKWDRAYNEERSRVVRLNQQTFNARALDAYNQWRLQRSAQTAVSGATTGIRGAAERARNTYIPAQFGQRILDNQRQQEYAQRMYNTYLPASLAQDAINRRGTGNDFNAYVDSALRSDYLLNADTEKMRAELDALSSELSLDEQRYNRMKAKYASYGNNVNDSGARAIKRYLDEYEAKNNKAEQIRRNLSDAEKAQKYAGYEALRQNADFAEKSQAGKSKRVQFSLTDPSTWAAGDDRYDFINDIDGYRDHNWAGLEFENAKVMGMERNLSEHAAVSKMTDGEIAMYNYLYATKGRKAADEYIDTIAEGLNYKLAQDDAANVGDNVLKGMSYGFQSGIDRFGTGVSDMFRSEATPTSATEYGSQLVRENLADTGFKLPEFMGGSSVGQVAFDMANTAGNMAPSILLATLTGGLGAASAVSGGVASASMGLSAGGSAKMQALRQGYSNEQATKYGLLVGASEGALQYLLGGISKLGGKFTGGIASRAIQNIDNALLRVAASGAIKMAGEGTEEYLQEILDPIYRNLLFDERNQIDLTDPNAVYSFMLGALTSGVMESPNTVRDLAGSVLTETTKARERAANQNINGALVSSNPFVQVSDTDTVNTPTAQQQTANTGVATASTNQLDRVPLGVSAQVKTPVEQATSNQGLNYTMPNPAPDVNLEAKNNTQEADVMLPAEPNLDRMEAGRDGREISDRLQDYKKRHERNFIARLSETFNIPKAAQADLIPMLSEIGDSVIRSGELSQEDSDMLFEAVYDSAREYDSKSEYQDFKKYLHDSAVRPDSIPKEYRKEARKFLNLRNDGKSITQLYEDISKEFQGFLDDSVTSPEDMLSEIIDLNNNMRGREYTLKELYGDDYESMKMAAKIDFEQDLYELRKKMNLVDRADVVSHAEQLASERAKLESRQVERVKGALSQVKKLKRELDNVKSKYPTLTKGDADVISSLHSGGLTLKDIENRANYNEIKEVFEAEGNLRKEQKIIELYNKRRRESLREDAIEALENSDDWKDKKTGIQYARETQQRNIQDIVKDDADADLINARYFDPVKKNEADKTRFINEMTKRVKAFGLNKWESKAAQMVGEKASYDESLSNSDGMNEALVELYEKGLADVESALDDLLKRHGNDIDLAKCENAANGMRPIFDELFEKANDAYIRNGYSPIEHRKGYFPHFIGVEADTAKAELFNVLGKNQNEIPTDIAGLTLTFRPGKTWFGHALERAGIKTTYDLHQGFDRYMRGIADVIYHTDDIQRLRALDNAIRYKYSDAGRQERIHEISNNLSLSPEERANQINLVYNGNDSGGTFSHLSNYVSNLTDYTNGLAGKKTDFDRVPEKLFNRKIYQLSAALDRQFMANAVGANIGVALSNFIPFTQAVSQVGMGDMLNAMQETVKSYAVADGFVDKSDFLTSRKGAEQTFMTDMQKLSKTASVPFEVIDMFVAETIVRAKYNQNINTGMSADAAMKNANDFAGGLMADRSKGALPTIFNSKSTLAKMFSMFQAEVNNQLSYMFKDLPRALKDKGTGAIAFGFFKMFLAAFLFNELDEKYGTGRRRAFDPIGLVRSAIVDFTGGKDGKTSKSDAAINLWSNVASEVPFIGNVLGGDGGRSHLESMTPNIANIVRAIGAEDADGSYVKQQVGNEFKKPLFYLLPPLGGGAQAKKTYEGIKTFIDGGSYRKNKQGDDQLQYRVDQTPENFVRMTLFGKWSPKEAQDYVAGGFKPLSADHTKAYKNAIANGVDGAYFLVLLNEYKALEPIKDAEGNTEKSKKQQFREILFNDTELTPEQKQAIDKDILCSDEQTPADYTSRDRFEISTTHAGGIFIPNDDPYERFTENINKGLTEAEAVLVEKWARKFSGLKSYTDSEGNEIGVKEQKRDMLLSDSTLTAEEKQLIDRSLISSNNTPADYSSDASFYVSQLSDSAQSGYKLFKASGGSQEKYMEYHKMYDELEPTKDINGETIPGSRQEALRNNIMNDDDMTPEQKRQLDEALTGGKTRDYTSWFTFKLGKTSGSAYKRGKAYVAAGISETNALLIEQWMDGRDYTKADLRKYLSKLKLTDSEIEAVLEARY